MIVLTLIPIPKSWREKFMELQVGECLEVTQENLKTIRTEITRLHHQQKDIQLTMRTLKDTGQKCVWRLK